MLDDLKAAFRSLTSSKTFTVVALIVLTLGIGASTAIFSVVDAVVLRGLPFDEHDRLVAVGERRPPGPDARPEPRPAGALSSAAPQNYIDWAAQQQVFESIAAIAGGAFTLREPGAEPEDLAAQRVTAGFFDVLRVQPAIGRAFTAEQRSRRPSPRRRPQRRRSGAAASAAIPRSSAARFRSKAAATKSLGVMPPDFAYPVGAGAPDRPLGAVRRPGRRADPEPEQLQHLPPVDRAAEAGRVDRAGAGADGPDRRGARADASRSGTRTTRSACGRCATTSSAPAPSRGC